MTPDACRPSDRTCTRYDAIYLQMQAAMGNPVSDHQIRCPHSGQHGSHNPASMYPHPPHLVGPRYPNGRVHPRSVLSIVKTAAAAQNPPAAAAAHARLR